MADSKVPIELVRPSFYGMLVAYYAGLMTYGVTASIWTLPTLVKAGGDHFAITWAIILATVSGAAMFGVGLSRKFDNRWIELAFTLAMVSMLLGYGFALLLRGINGNPSVIAAAWLPIIIAVLPSWRMLVMVADGSLSPKHEV